MKARKWSSADEAYLKKHYPLGNLKSICKKLRRSDGAVKARAQLLCVYRKVHGNSPWTPEMDKKLKKLYPAITNKEIGERMNVTMGQIEARAFRLGLHKTKEFMLMHTARTCFKKGQSPVNKGKKQTEFMSRAAIERTKATRFKKGNLPHNTKQKDGTITTRHNHKERGERPYKYIRTSLGVWEPLQIYKWKKKYGEIQAGHCLWCKNGDTMNCNPSNWEVITRAENLRRNNAGEKRYTDKLVAFYIVGRTGYHLLDEVMKDKKLLQVKRQQLLLKRQINDTAANTVKA